MNLFKLILNGSDEYIGQIKNWQDLMPVLARNEKYRTILPANTINKLELVKEAGAAIKSVYETYGVLGSTSIEIKRWNGTDYGAYLLGEIDYPQYDRDNDLNITYIGIKEASFISKWLNRDEVETSLQDLIDMDGNAITPFSDETVSVNMHNQSFDQYVKASYYQEENLNFFGTETNFFGLWGNSAIIQLGTDTETINEITDQYFTIPVDNVGIRDANVADVTPFMELDADPVFDLKVEIDISGSFEFRFTLGDESLTPTNIQIFLILRRYNHSTELYENYTVDNFFTDFQVVTENSFTNLLSEHVRNVDQSFVHTLSSGFNAKDTYSLYCHIADSSEFNDEGGFCFMRDETSFSIDVKKERRYKETACESMLVYDAFLRSLQKMTGLNDPLRSTFYGRTDSPVNTYASDGDGAKRAVSNGFQVRQFPIEDHPIYTEFFKLFEVFNALDNIGVGLITEDDTQYIAIEPIEFFMNKENVAFVVTDPAGFKEVPAAKYLYSEVKFGNTKYEDQKQTILRSPHTPRTYITGLDEVLKNTYKVENPAILSGHLIEQMRQDPYVDGASKDSRYDNDLVVISVVRDGSNWNSEKDEDFDTVTGIEYPTLQYNLKLTPIRTIINHTNFLVGGFKRFNDASVSDKSITFQKGLGNIELETELTGEGYTLSESESITETKAQTPLFIPDYQEYEIPITQEQWETILANPNQVIEVSWRGATYKGFLEYCKVDNPNSLKADFKQLKVYQV